MKNRSRKVILVITALLTFSVLMAAKGKMYRHHAQHYSEHCIKGEHSDHWQGKHWDRRWSKKSQTTDK